MKLKINKGPPNSNSKKVIFWNAKKKNPYVGKAQTKNSYEVK